MSRETLEALSGRVSYSGIHAWRLGDGKCVGFESFYDDAYYDFWSGRG